MVVFRDLLLQYIENGGVVSKLAFRAGIPAALLEGVVTANQQLSQTQELAVQRVLILDLLAGQAALRQLVSKETARQLKPIGRVAGALPQEPLVPQEPPVTQEPMSTIIEPLPPLPDGMSVAVTTEAGIVPLTIDPRLMITTLEAPSPSAPKQNALMPNFLKGRKK